MLTLAEKLRQADGGMLIHALALQTDENYFSALRDMLRNDQFIAVYTGLIAPNMERRPDILCRVLHQLPYTEKRAEMLYQILIAPFTAMRAFDRIDDDEEEDETNDAYDY